MGTTSTGRSFSQRQCGNHGRPHSTALIKAGFTGLTVTGTFSTTATAETYTFNVTFWERPRTNRSSGCYQRHILTDVHHVCSLHHGPVAERGPAGLLQSASCRHTIMLGAGSPSAAALLYSNILTWMDPSGVPAAEDNFTVQTAIYKVLFLAEEAGATPEQLGRLQGILTAWRVCSAVNPTAS